MVIWYYHWFTDDPKRVGEIRVIFKDKLMIVTTAKLSRRFLAERIDNR